MREDEVVGLYERVTEHSTLPVMVYDNPTTTRLHFTLDVFARIAALPIVASLKISPLPAHPQEAAALFVRFVHASRKI